MKRVKKSTILAVAMVFVMIFTSGIVNTSYAAAKTQKKITAYTYQPYTYVHKKASNKSAATKLPIKYKSKVIVYGNYTGKLKKSRWVKIKYNKKIYYTYVKKGTTAFTKKGISYSKYKKAGTTALKQQAVDDAIRILKTKKTHYSHKTPGSVVNGKMQFDCSGFASYIIEGVLGDTVKNLDVPHDIEDLYRMSWMYTGAEGGFSAKTVCTKKPDFKKLQPGDLVFFLEDESSKKAYDHVGIYIGNKEFINSTKFTDGVSIMPLSYGKYNKRFVRAVRVLPDTAPEAIGSVISLSANAYVYSDIKLKNQSDKLSAGDEVTLLFETPVSWTSDYNCAYITYGDGKTGFISSSKLK